MVQVLEEKTVSMNCVDVEQVNYEMRSEQVKAQEAIKPKQVGRKPAKKGLSRLFKKVKLNAKFSEHEIPIHRLERQRVYRDYGVR